MQDTIVGENVKAEYVITDKDAVISDDVEIKGVDTFPIYIAKHQQV